MQAKDIPDEPILRFLASIYPRWGNYVPLTKEWASCCQRSVLNAMPTGVTAKLALAKMRKLIGRGLSSGCTCGCRGDFEITDKGRQFLDKASTPKEPKDG
jgi:hypothetical protein